MRWPPRRLKGEAVPDAVDLYVDLDAMQQLVNKLAQIKDALDHAHDDLQSYGPALGSQKVSDDLNGFVDGWKDGRKKIVDNVDKLYGKVQGVAQTYLEQEQKLASASQNSGGQSDGAPPRGAR